jgi:arylsulfatase A-like enzyme
VIARRATAALMAWAGAGAACGGAEGERPAGAGAAGAGASGEGSDARVADAAAGRARVDEPPRIEHPVFSLGDNLLMAHRSIDGELVIDAGSISFARYTRLDRPLPRWRRAQELGGQRVARAARGGAIEVPLTAAQAQAARGLAVRLVAERAGTLRVRVGGGPAATIAVEPGRRWYPVVTAGAAWHAGDNLIDFDREVALEDLRVSADPPAVAAAELAADDRAPIGWDDARRALALDRGAGLAWYLQLPAAPALVATVADPNCTVDVRATTEDGGSAAGELGGGRTRVELSAVGGRAVRLELAARGCARAELADPAITIAGSPPAAPPAGPPPRYVVLWIFDALRADKVRPFTPGARAEVPHFEALAADSAVFRQHYVGGNESQVSHSSLWTSTYPAVHDVRPVGIGGSWRLPRRLPVLGELVRAGGLTPLAVTGNGFVIDVAGYGRGFDEYRNMMREKGIINGILYGEHVLEHALARLAARKDEPLFFFLGTVDTHGPWIARKPWIDRYSPGYRGPFERFARAYELGIVQGQMGCSKIPAPREIERLRAIYDSAISYHDAQLGALIAGLKDLGIYEQTMIVLTADHGEELFEDGRCGHGGSLRESLVRVPLLVHYPPRIAPGVVEEGVEGIDVLPTILEALDVELPAGLQGQPLAALAAGAGRGWPRPSYASQFEYAHALRIGRWKLKAGKRGAPHLIDLVDDPEERRDVAAAHPLVRRAMIDALGLFLATRERWHKRTMGVVTNLAPGAAARLEGVR